MRDRLIIEGNSVVHHKQQDVEPALERARMLRDAGAPVLASESWHVGSIPMIVVAQWMQEAGKAWDDHEAMREIIDAKLHSGEFAKFRVREGSYR
jgi:hypothetical protein